MRPTVRWLSRTSIPAALRRPCAIAAQVNMLQQFLHTSSVACPPATAAVYETLGAPDQVLRSVLSLFPLLSCNWFEFSFRSGTCVVFFFCLSIQAGNVDNLYGDIGMQLLRQFPEFVAIGD